MREDATGKQPAVQGSSETAHEAGISCPRKGTQSGRRSRGEHPGSASAFPTQIGRTASPSFPGGTRLFAAAVYDRRAVLAPFAGVAVNKEKNAALAVIMGWLVIKGDTISPVLVVKAIFFFNFNLPHPI